MTSYALTFKNFTFSVLILSIPLTKNIALSHFIGSHEKCNDKNFDGYHYFTKTKCYSCSHKNGFLECFKKNCPNVEGCYRFQFHKNDCCKKCQGCFKDNIYYDSGTEWTDPSNLNTKWICVAGILTRSSLRCYTPCDNPIPPISGQACPTCPGCEYKNKTINVDTLIMPKSDTCVSCSCTSGTLNKQGMMCIKKTCPVINCPASKIIHKPENCCPECQGIGTSFNLPDNVCLFKSTKYLSGMKFQPDNCTNCTCVNSTIICDKISCPVLLCKSKNQIHSSEKCCPVCKNSTGDSNYNFKKKIDLSIKQKVDLDKRYYLEGTCNHDGKVYNNGEIWNLSRCEICTCNHGRVNCTAIKCYTLNCPPNSYLKVLPGHCCPVCIESRGVCHLLRGSEIRTYDGLSYDSLGSGRYLLSADCDGKTFNIIIKNIIEENDVALKKISLKIFDIKIDLQVNKKIKVNNSIIELPYFSKNAFNIFELNNRIIVTTKIGVTVKWNYKSIFQVTVPNIFQKKLCGLCGNYNSLPEDDLTTSQNILVNDPIIFAQSWTLHKIF